MLANTAIVGGIAVVLIGLWWLITKPLHPSDRVLSALFLAFARSEFTVVKNGPYDLHLTSPMGELKCWNANRWYAWASEGSFTPTNPAEGAIVWKDRMPGRRASRRMRNALEAVELRRFAAAERGEIALDLRDYAHAGYCVKRPPGVRGGDGGPAA
jgi:hypothetical protein